MKNTGESDSATKRAHPLDANGWRECGECGGDIDASYEHGEGRHDVKCTVCVVCDAFDANGLCDECAAWVERLAGSTG